MSKARFTKHLKELNIEEMRHELLALYDKVPGVKQYYSMELGTDKDRERIYAKAKKEIVAKYATKSFRRPRRPRIQKINAIIARIEKASIFEHELVDFYLFDLETALVFIARYNFYSTVLGNHIVKIFEKAAIAIAREQIQSMYQERCDLILDRAVLIPEVHWELTSKYRECFNDDD